MKIIVGAGLAGLLAAHAWPTATLYEAAAGPRAMHRALLRFRSDAVSKLTGIEFRKVTVRKGLWLNNKFVQPSIQLANLYSEKVIGRLANDRSIWSLEPVERFIAPESLYDQLIEAVGPRIVWGCKYDTFTGEPTVSTAPLPITLQTLDLGAEVDGGPISKALKRAAIYVSRWRVPRSDVYQTIYYPSADTPVYRASITGDLLIVESMAGIGENHPFFEDVYESFFGSKLFELDKLDTSAQAFGKIVPLQDSVRKHILHELTDRHNIFSLGRFATWRNILLDDVVNDIAVIRKLLRSPRYDRRKHAS